MTRLYQDSIISWHVEVLFIRNQGGLNNRLNIQLCSHIMQARFWPFWNLNINNIYFVRMRKRLLIWLPRPTLVDVSVTVSQWTTQLTKAKFSLYSPLYPATVLLLSFTKIICPNSWCHNLANVRYCTLILWGYFC